MHYQSQTSLVKSTMLALVIALITLVLVILPAEYNIDATGIGTKLGLTAFSQTANSQATNSSSTKQSADSSDAIVLTVPAGKGIEYKLTMEQFQKVSYEWLTSNDNSSLYVDLHGEPKGDTTGYFESYTIATTNNMKGSFTAPFAGSHGWYWKNNSDQDIQLQLLFSGDYVIEGLK